MGPLIRLETTLTGTGFRTVRHPTRQEWLQEHSSDFRHSHCPPKSPDMNIIEPLWVALQCAVQKRSPPPDTLMDLRTALQDSWCEKPPGYFQTLVDTMPRRVAALLCARVGLKRY
ncbi:hypothetical protein AVEN_47655-1 [Araneus ventricosus]|uniref:Tc1-like transposase DDE domain-containing protein n=1 Tax=Araneus ventricosus TaxID=182803 RepID=A0A4Y2I027_ARAVE|nr:hypothetical protein AVEN_47655-1 [Araneus ventricosus]